MCLFILLLISFLLFINSSLNLSELINCVPFIVKRFSFSFGFFPIYISLLSYSLACVFAISEPLILSSGNIFLWGFSFVPILFKLIFRTFLILSGDLQIFGFTFFFSVLKRFLFLFSLFNKLMLGFNSLKSIFLFDSSIPVSSVLKLSNFSFNKTVSLF